MASDDIREETLDAGLGALFRKGGPRPGESVLESIARQAGQSAPVLLRDPADDPTPVLKLHDDGQAPGEDDRYQILGEIARGGVGVVFKARDKDLGRDVAIKVLRAEHVGRKEVLERFVEEAQIEGQLQHPGILPIYGLGLQPDRRPFIAMKLVKGRTLAALLSDRADPARRRRRFLEIFERICQTIAYAHSRGVIHRDLKPSNVMVGAFGEVQVMDWGFAKVLGHESEPHSPIPEATIVRTVRSAEVGSHSVAGSVMGTPAYMPPEQALGQIAELDERCDVFALGAVLCEILTGAPPYAGEKEDLLLMAAQARLEDAIGRLDSCGADASLVGLAKDCLAPVRADRPRDALRVAITVAEHLAAVEERARREELEAAEARANHEEKQAALAAETLRAEEERARLAAEKSSARRERTRAAREQHRAEAAVRMRRRERVLAAVGITGILVGAAFLLWNAADERDRASRQRALVAQAIQRARELEGERRWREAVAAVNAAVALAREGGESVEDAGNLLGRLHEGERKEAEAARHREKEARLLERLQEVRLRRTDEFDEGATDQGYREAFRDFGIDAEADPPARAAEALRALQSPVQAAAALDAWSQLRRVNQALKGKEWKRLREIARLTDPDPWRNDLRAADEEGDFGKLRTLAETADIDALPLATLILLSNALSLATLEEAKEWNESLLRRVHERHPSDPWTNALLAHALVSRRPPRPAEALSYATAACAARPRSPGLWANLGWYHAANGDRERMTDAIDHALRLNPDYWDAHHRRGHLLQAQEDWDGALECFLRVIELRPDLPTGYCDAASVYWRQEERPKAYAMARKAIEVAPDMGLGYFQLGALLAADDKTEEALEQYRKAAELWPRHGNVRVRISRLHAHVGETEKAVAVAREVVGLYPDNEYAHECLGTALHVKGDFAGAARSYEKALEIRSELSTSRSRLGLACAEMGRWKEAREHCAEAAWRNPTVGTVSTLCLVQQMECDLGAAAAAAQEYVRLDPESVSSFGGLASCLGHAGDHDGALAACEKALELDSSSAAVFRMLATVRVARGELDEASAALAEAERLMATRDERGTLRGAQATLGRVQLALGRFRRAAESLERARQVQERGWTSFPIAWDAEEDARLLGLAKRVAPFEGRVAEIAAGTLKPSGPAEAVDFAMLCHFRQEHAAAVTLLEQAYAADADLAGDPDRSFRFEGACAAARAGSTERALEWLRSELEHWRARLGTGAMEDRIRVRAGLYRMRAAIVFRKREQYGAFLAEVEELLAEALGGAS